MAAEVVAVVVGEDVGLTAGVLVVVVAGSNEVKGVVVAVYWKTLRTWGAGKGTASLVSSCALACW